jgi:NADH-quinone oxidoreductase subunit N
MEFVFPVIFWKSFLPLPILTFGAVLVLLFDIFASKKNRQSAFCLSILVLLFAFVSCLLVDGRSSEISFGGMYLFDGFTKSLFLIILFSSFIVVLMSSIEGRFEKNSYGDFLGLILFATLGMMLMVSTRNLVMIFIALEIFSLSLYVLAGFFRSSSIGNEASLKYFLLGSFASGFLLFGIALIYGSTGSTDLFDIIKFYELSTQK